MSEFFEDEITSIINLNQFKLHPNTQRHQFYVDNYTMSQKPPYNENSNPSYFSFPCRPLCYAIS